MSCFESLNEFSNERWDWKDTLFIIPILPAILCIYIYIKIFDLFDNEERTQFNS